MSVCSTRLLADSSVRQCLRFFSGAWQTLVVIHILVKGLVVLAADVVICVRLIRQVVITRVVSA